MHEKTEPIAPITDKKVDSFEEDIMPQLPSISSDSADQMETQNREIPVDSKVNAEKAKKIINLNQLPPNAGEIPLESLQHSAEQQQVKVQDKNRPIFWRMSAQNLKILGLIFICFGGLLLLGSLLAYFGAFSGNGNASDAGAGAWANFFIDLITISNWFWLLVFILAVILVLYLGVLLVRYVFGGPLIAPIVGLSMLIIGILLYALGERREIEI